MSSPDPTREYGENERKELFKKARMARKMKKSGGMLGELERLVRESKEARSPNWRKHLGKTSPAEKKTFKEQREHRQDSFRQNHPDDRSGI